MGRNLPDRRSRRITRSMELRPRAPAPSADVAAIVLQQSLSRQSRYIVFTLQRAGKTIQISIIQIDQSQRSSSAIAKYQRREIELY
jgi:hypothetical protein